VSPDKKVTVRLPKGTMDAAVKTVADQVQGDRTTAELVKDIHGRPLDREIFYERARLAYITDRHQRSVEAFWPIMQGTMSPSSFVNRTVREGWKPARRRVVAQAQNELIRRVGRQVLKDQMEEVNQLMEVRDNLLHLITPQKTEVEQENGTKGTIMKYAVEPKSLEGCIRAFKDVSILLVSYRDQVSGRLSREAPPVADDVSGSVSGPLTSGDAGMVARQILQRQLEERTPDEGDEDDE